MTAAFALPGGGAAPLVDLDAWGPVLERALEPHGLARHAAEAQPGTNPTYPTFVCGDVVAKLYGGFADWRRAFAAESAMLARLAGDTGIPAPRVVATGRLQEEAWPVLVMSRIPGEPALTAELEAAGLDALAEAVGVSVRRLHGLPPRALPVAQADDLPAALARSSLPPHLIAQAPAFVAALPRRAPVVCHQDLTATHVFVDAAGSLTGIIDWADAGTADPHVELIQVFRDLLRCEAEPFRTFLASAAWPREADFPRLALGHALRRQALGAGQHRSIDVFQPIAARWPLADIPTLSDLAELLFGAAVP